MVAVGWVDLIPCDVAPISPALLGSRGVKDGEPVGCAALLKMGDGGYEVAKMTVAEGLRGSGLGRRLMERCIAAGAQDGAARLYLETNSSLAPALALYRATGFKDLAPTETPYVRADVFMERRY